MGGLEDDGAVTTVVEELVVEGVDGGDAVGGSGPHRVAPAIRSRRRRRH